ncbi:MAG: FtsX-like permease family protein, partial [Thermoanaerobaculia bacterium]
MSLLGRASRRYHLRHPAQFALALVGVALGVAVVVAIDLANESSLRAFAFATDATAGATTDQIAGDSNGFDETLFARIRAGTDDLPGIRAAAPVVEDFVVLPRDARSAASEAAGEAGVSSLSTTAGVGRNSTVLRLLGLDPWSEAPLRGYLRIGKGGALAEGADLASFLTVPGAALLESGTAARLGVEVGESFAVQIGARRESLKLVGCLAPADDAGREALANLVLVDIATAQEILDLPGRLTRIDLALPEGDAGDAARARIEKLLPPGVRLTRASSRPAALEQMTRAFRFNLKALSLLALLCGTFLIYNTMTFSVVQRRELFGRLRALGVRRGEILALVMTEAAFLGIVGSALGLALGVVLGR